MKIERTQVWGFENAIYGMRAPMNSWDRSDTDFSGNLPSTGILLGPNDAELARRLIRSGKEHRKFLRTIHIQTWFELPRYIWTELDTYKVATVRVSQSTIHKLGTRDLTIEDFQDGFVLPGTLEMLNTLGKEYREHKTESLLRTIKQILPENFLQGAIYDMNYETAITMYHQRRTHRLPEWSGKNGICDWVRKLPMMSEWLGL